MNRVIHFQSNRGKGTVKKWGERGGAVGRQFFFLAFAVPLEKLDNLAISKGSIIQYSATHEMWVVLFYNRNSDTYFF